MKGIIFTLLEHRILADYGEEAWDRIVEDADVDGIYTTLGNYSHEELLDLLEAAEAYTGKSGAEALRWFGRDALHQLADKYPDLFEPHASTRAFALTINGVIHPEVRKLYPGAQVPTFDVDEHPEQGDLMLRYRSTRGLCYFAEGLLHGTADHYGEQVNVEQPSCVHKSDDHCDLLLQVHSTPDEGGSARG